MAARKSRKRKPGVQLIVSDSKTPTIQARPGVKIEILNVTTEEGRPTKLGARLCGYGSGSCLALIETE